MEQDLAEELHGLKAAPETGLQTDSKINKDASSMPSKQEDQMNLRQPRDPKQHMPHALRKIPTTIGKMIDKKQILHSSSLNASSRYNFGSSTAGPGLLKKAQTTVADDKKKKSYSGGSMYNFFKQQNQNDGTAIKKELLARSKDTVPMVFRQRNAKI